MKKYLLLFLALLLFSLTPKAHAQSMQHIQIPVGTQGVVATEYRFSPEFEDVAIKKIRFLNTTPNTNDAIERVFLYEGNTRLASATMNGDYASFENLNIIIERRQERVLTLIVNISNRRDLSGKAPSFKFNDPTDWLAGGDIEAVGVQSGSKLTNYTNNTLTILRRLNIYDTTIMPTLAPDSPYGYKGVANGQQEDLMYLNITAAANPTASSPRTAIINTLGITFSGDAEVRNVQIFGPANNYTSPIATSATDHLGGTTLMVIPIQGADAAIDYGTTKLYRIKGDVTAVTDSSAPSRSVRVGIENFGTSTVAGDITWYENGLPSNNPDSQLVDWIYDPTGVNELRAPHPLNFGSQPAVGIPTQQIPIVPAPQAYPYTTIDISNDTTETQDTTTEETTEEDEGRDQFMIIDEDVSFTDPVLTSLEGRINPFPDTALDKLEGKAALELQRRSIISGFPDGTFGGTQKVNRAQAAKMLLNARFGEIADRTNNQRFTDVREGEWYVRYIVDAAERGIINGYPDGLFRPENTVNTAEFLKMLTLTFGLELNLEHSYRDVNITDWFNQYAGIAKKYDLFPERRFFLIPARELTRNEVAIAIYQYLKNRDQ